MKIKHTKYVLFSAFLLVPLVSLSASRYDTNIQLVELNKRLGKAYQNKLAAESNLFKLNNKLIMAKKAAKARPDAQNLKVRLKKMKQAKKAQKKLVAQKNKAWNVLRKEKKKVLISKRSMGKKKKLNKSGKPALTSPTKPKK